MARAPQHVELVLEVLGASDGGAGGGVDGGGGGLVRIGVQLVKSKGKSFVGKCIIGTLSLVRSLQLFVVCKCMFAQRML